VAHCLAQYQISITIKFYLMWGFLKCLPFIPFCEREHVRRCFSVQWIFSPFWVCFSRLDFKDFEILSLVVLRHCQGNWRGKLGCLSEKSFAVCGLLDDLIPVILMNSDTSKVSDWLNELLWWRKCLAKYQFPSCYVNCESLLSFIAMEIDDMWTHSFEYSVTDFLACLRCFVLLS
jgi:hypothetical protein